MLRDDTVWRFRRRNAVALARIYRRIASEVIVPLVADDALEQSSDQTQVFFRVVKPGASEKTPRPLPPPVCVLCHRALEDASPGLRCSSCGARYPVIRGVPVLMSRAMEADERARSAPRDPRKVVRGLMRGVHLLR